jgi:hypothetical protein
VGASIGLATLATLAATRTTHVLTGVATTPGHTAAALTDGYTLAFTVAAIVLLVTAAVAVAALPSMRQPSPAAATARMAELDEALETP